MAIDAQSEGTKLNKNEITICRLCNTEIVKARERGGEGGRNLFATTSAISCPWAALCKSLRNMVYVTAMEGNDVLSFLWNPENNVWTEPPRYSIDWRRSKGICTLRLLRETLTSYASYEWFLFRVCLRRLRRREDARRFLGNGSFLETKKLERKVLSCLQEDATLLQLLGSGDRWSDRKFGTGQSRPETGERQFRKLRNHRRPWALVLETLRIQSELLRRE